MKTTAPGARVAALVPNTEARRAQGEAFGAIALQLVSEALHKHSPMPGGQLAKDLLRQRTLSIVSYGSVLIALASVDPDAAAAVFAALSAWVLSLAAPAAMPLTEAAVRDAKEQGEADAAVFAAMAAAERKDTYAIELAIREQSESVAAAQSLLRSLHQERAKIETPRRSLYRVVRPMAAGAAT